MAPSLGACSIVCSRMTASVSIGVDEEAAPIEEDVIRQYGERAKQQRANPEYGMTYWKAALRQIEGKGSDWRQ